MIEQTVEELLAFLRTRTYAHPIRTLLDILGKQQEEIKTLKKLVAKLDSENSIRRPLGASYNPSYQTKDGLIR